ncbi:dihydrolipoyl dehydrogenase [Chloroflexota bacterium]
MAKRIVIIGGGPGGYVAAIRASQLGAEVTLIERDTLGGTCLNRGCIPTKALLESANALAGMRNVAVFGISAEKVSMDFSAVAKRKKAVIRQLVSGVNSLVRKNKIEVIKGTGTLVDPRTVEIVETRARINADNIIVATGSKPATVSIKGIDEPGVITSNEALAMEELPDSVVIIGGGVIGLEFAQIIHRLGSKATIVEMMPQVLPTEDTEIANMLADILAKEGIEIFTGASVTSISGSQPDKKVVTFTTKNASKGQERAVEKVLLAVGRSPNTDDLGVDKLSLNVDKGRLVVNERMETSIPGIYATGDVVGGLMLAHVAMEEGKCAVENILGNDCQMNYQTVPRCVYTSPAVACVGLTEAKARQDYGKVKVGRFPFRANGKALILNDTAGMVKIITDAKYGQILGAHIIGPQATELIAEAVLGMKMGATSDDLASTIHAHPTLSEAVMEAFLNVRGRQIHL